MKRISALIGAVCIACMAAGSPAIGATVTYDMDSFSTGNYSEAGFNALFSGVSFRNSAPGGGFGVTSISGLGADFTQPNAILNAPYDSAGNMTTATFANFTDFVSVTIGDYDADPDSLYLKAYDANNQLLGSDFFANPASSFDGHTLVFSTVSPLIAKVEFYGVGLNNNSVYWDNFSYGRTPSAVPEPGTMMMLGSGILGLALARRRNNGK